MKFSIEVVPEVEAKVLRQRAVRHEKPGAAVFIARPCGRFDLAGFGIDELSWLPDTLRSTPVGLIGEPRVAITACKWHRSELPSRKRRLAGMSIDVHILSAQESRQRWEGGSKRRFWRMQSSREVLVERPGGLTRALIRMKELCSVPRYPIPVVRITNHQLTDDFFEGLPEDLKIPHPARRRM